MGDDDVEHGLSSAAAARQLARDGHHELSSPDRRTAQGIDLRGWRALADRRHDLASAIGRHSARACAYPYRISGNGINPACSIVFAAEAPEQNIMCRPPRRVGERLFGRQTAVFAVLQGLGLLAAAAALFLIGRLVGVGRYLGRAGRRSEPSGATAGLPFLAHWRWRHHLSCHGWRERHGVV